MYYLTFSVLLLVLPRPTPAKPPTSHERSLDMDLDFHRLVRSNPASSGQQRYPRPDSLLPRGNLLSCLSKSCASRRTTGSSTVPSSSSSYYPPSRSSFTSFQTAPDIPQPPPDPSLPLAHKLVIDNTYMRMLRAHTTRKTGEHSMNAAVQAVYSAERALVSAQKRLQEPNPSFVSGAELDDARRKLRELERKRTKTNTTWKEKSRSARETEKKMFRVLMKHRMLTKGMNGYVSGLFDGKTGGQEGDGNGKLAEEVLNQMHGHWTDTRAYNMLLQAMSHEASESWFPSWAEQQQKRTKRMVKLVNNWRHGEFKTVESQNKFVKELDDVLGTTKRVNGLRADAPMGLSDLRVLPVNYSNREGPLPEWM